MKNDSRTSDQLLFAKLNINFDEVTIIGFA
jgi:hypothetical protein